MFKWQRKSVLRHKSEADLDVIANDCPNCKNTTEELHKLARSLLKVSSSITLLGVDVYEIQRKINTVKKATEQIQRNLGTIKSMSSGNENEKTSRILLSTNIILAFDILI